MRFRKKPIVIEAFRWYKPGDLGIFQGPQPDPRCGWCETLEGGHVVSPGDWIITGVKGERYPCKPDIFDLTYENAEAFESPQPAQADEALTCSDAREERVGCYRAVRAENRADEAVALLRNVVRRYDDYRGKGVMPAPGEYQMVVGAIERIRAFLKDRT